METYLPYPNFVKCAKTLQVAELVTSIDTALNVFAVKHEMEGFTQTFWVRHPVVRMWEDHLPMLYQYSTVLLEEVSTREDSTPARKALCGSFQARLDKHLEWETSGEYSLDAPRWLGDLQLHLAHRAELFRLEPDVYGPLFESTLDTSKPLFWPLG